MADPAGQIDVAACDAQVAQVAAAARRLVSDHAGRRLVWHVWPARQAAGGDAGGSDANGDGNGAPAPALVLLHGGHGSWTHWIRNVLALSARHDVWAADMPGYGESDELAGPLSLPAMAQQLSDGFAQLAGAARRCNLVGFSLGSVTAGCWAALRPAQLQRLVLVGAAGLGLARQPRPSMMSWRRLAHAHDRLALHRHNLASLMLRSQAAIDDLAVHLQMVNSARARARSRDLVLGDLLARQLDRLPVPVYGLWGDGDVTALPDLPARADLLRRLQPGAGFVVIPQAGHWVQYEQPQAFDAALLEIVCDQRA